MKIFFLIRSLSVGGAERQLVTVAKGLHDRGHDVHVGVFYGGGPFESDLHEAAIPVTILNKHGRWDIAAFLYRLSRLLRDVRPDVIHGYMATSNYVGLITKPIHRAKVVWGVLGSDLDGNLYDWAHRVDVKLEQSVSRFPDLIISNSQSGKKAAVNRGFPASRTVVIPSGIDTDRFRPDKQLREATRNLLGVAEGEFLVGRIGRLDPVKDYPTFLRAAALVAAKLPNARFVCVGGGFTDYQRELHELGQSLGLGDRVIWTGSRSDMQGIYNALDLLVSSSISEGLSYVVAEAMACEVPCVVTDCGDSAWTVGDTGSVVAVSDSVLLAEAILDQRAAIEAGNIDRNAIRQRIISHMSLDQLVSRTEAAIGTVLQLRTAT